MRYPGPFTFINRDSTTVSKGRGYKDDSAISTHIARTRSRWTEEKRRAKLRPSAHAHGLTGWELKRRREVGDRHQVAEAEDGEGSDIFTLPVRTTTTTTSIEPASDRECGSCVGICPRCTKRLITNDTHNHDTRTSQPPHKRTHTNTPSHTTTSPLPLTTTIPRGNGNTDPFSASLLPITPQTHALLLLSAHFYVFWAWPAASSTVFRQKSQDMWVKAVSEALRGTVEMRVILAAGARIRARLLREADGEGQGEVRGGTQGRQDKGAEREALKWKASALSDLREKMLNDETGKGKEYLQAVFRWVSLEFCEGNFEAALWHHRAARELVRRNTGRARSGDDDGGVTEVGVTKEKTATYAVAEVWAATAALEKPLPCGMVDFSGERIASGAHEEVVPVPHSSHTFYLYGVEWWDVHVSIVSPTLKQLFLEIRKVILYMDALGARAEDPVATFETVSYLGAQSSKLRAEILGLWVDHGRKGLGMSSGGVDEHPNGPGAKMEDLVFSASCLAALLFVNIIFMYKPNSLEVGVPATPLMSPAVNRQALLRLQEALRAIRWHQMQWDGNVDGRDTVDLDLLTWLSFMAALGETLEAEASRFPIVYQSQNIGAGDVSSDDVGRQCFKDCCTIFGWGNWQEGKSILVNFLFVGGLMDGYLARFFDVLHENSVL